MHLHVQSSRSSVTMSCSTSRYHIRTAAHPWAIYTHIPSLGVVGTARSRDHSSVLSVDSWYMNHCWDGVETTTSPEPRFTRDSLLSTPTIPTPRGPPTGTHGRFPIVFSGTGSPTRYHIRPFKHALALVARGGYLQQKRGSMPC
jgi:hypothetical protein